jgi:hypothetical protein
MITRLSTVLLGLAPRVQPTAVSPIPVFQPVFNGALDSRDKPEDDGLFFEI